MSPPVESSVSQSACVLDALQVRRSASTLLSVSVLEEDADCPASARNEKVVALSASPVVSAIRVTGIVRGEAGNPVSTRVIREAYVFWISPAALTETFRLTKAPGSRVPPAESRLSQRSAA